MQFKEAIKFYSFIQMMLMCKNIGHESCIILEIVFHVLKKGNKALVMS